MVTALVLVLANVECLEDQVGTNRQTSVLASLLTRNIAPTPSARPPHAFGSRLAKKCDTEEVC